MARTLKSDKMLFLPTLLLVGMSVVMVYSASALQAHAQSQGAAFFLVKQIAWAVVGITLMLVVMRVDYRQYRQPAVIWPLLAVAVALLIAVFFFEPKNGARRWIALGPLSFQPSEFAKLAAILFAVALLDRRMHRINDLGFALAPIGLVTVGLSSLILMEPDLGTAAVLVGVAVAGGGRSAQPEAARAARVSIRPKPCQVSRPSGKPGTSGLFRSLALASMMARTCSFVIERAQPRSSAASPLTWGAAIDVPVKKANAAAPPVHVE